MACTNERGIQVSDETLYDPTDLCHVHTVQRLCLVGDSRRVGRSDAQQPAMLPRSGVTVLVPYVRREKFLVVSRFLEILVADCVASETSPAFTPGRGQRITQGEAVADLHTGRWHPPRRTSGHNIVGALTR